MKNISKLLVFVPLFLLTPEIQKMSAMAKMDAAVKKAFLAEKSVDVLVELNAKADLSLAETILNREARIQYVYDQLRATAQVSQAQVLSLIQTKGALQVQSFYIMNAILIRGVSAETLQIVAQSPDVKAVHANPKIRLDLPKDDGPTIDDPNLESSIKFIKADQVWGLGFKGKGIVIAGQDTGYSWDHPALKAKYRGFVNGMVDHNYNWHDSVHESVGTCGSNSPAPCDDHGHGTHTMGTMLGDDGGINKIGVAPDAKWIGCRNMDGGIGTPSTYLECFEFFLAPYPQGGNPQADGRPDLAPHIISNSWSCPVSEGCAGGEFYDVIKALHAAGIMVVVAAGNDGPGCGTIADPPAYSDEAAVIGAFDHSADNIASFSSRGPAKWNNGVGPDFVAPGVAIRSSVPGGEYGYMSGTSMATPHVAGAVALLWSARPELVGKIRLTIDLIRKTALGKTSLQTCGQYSGSEIPNAVYGYGVIDIYKAVTTQR